MKIHIHPDYIELKEFLRDIPQESYRIHKVFCDQRNIVEKVTINGKAFVVKKYKKPTVFNQVVYTWFRKSKAKRAFEYAEKLLEAGVETAFPAAYIEIKKYGFFHTGYFISEYLPYPLLEDISLLDEEEKRQLKNDFLLFMVHLHQKKIVHKDFNPGNIFYHKVSGIYRFAFVDINRMSFGKNNMELCIRGFHQMNLELNQLFDFVDQYARMRHFNTLDCLLSVLKYRKRVLTRDRIKKAFRKKQTHGE